MKKFENFYFSWFYVDICVFICFLTPEIHWNGLFYSKINRNAFLGHAHAQIWVKLTKIYSSYLYHDWCLFLHFLTPEIHLNENRKSVPVSVLFTFFSFFEEKYINTENCNARQSGKRVIAYGRYTAYIRPIYGRYTADIRPIYGRYTADIRPIDGR